MSIKIGDRVLCINDSGHNQRPIIIKSSLKKGREYIVYGIFKCLCGSISYDVGIVSHVYSSVCKSCSGSFEANGVWRCHSSRFVKAETRTEVNYVKVEIEIEEPILN